MNFSASSSSSSQARVSFSPRQTYLSHSDSGDAAGWPGSTGVGEFGGLGFGRFGGRPPPPKTTSSLTLSGVLTSLISVVMFVARYCRETEGTILQAAVAVSSATAIVAGSFMFVGTVLEV